mmetsp:Transcript_46246/g.117075  ORF Transcript_46246/g.117075 Transcript_46246/m.117075 type:complete len:113 (+) Transcript_46246:65-403(+)
MGDVEVSLPLFTSDVNGGHLVAGLPSPGNPITITIAINTMTRQRRRAVSSILALASCSDDTIEPLCHRMWILLATGASGGQLQRTRAGGQGGQGYRLALSARRSAGHCQLAE